MQRTLKYTEVRAAVLGNSYRIPRGQISLYKALYEAGEAGMSKNKLAEMIRWEDKESLQGVINALGLRITNSVGRGDRQRATDLLLETKRQGNDLHYKMRPELRQAIDSIPELRTAIQQPIDVIMRKYDGEANWLTITIS